MRSSLALTALALAASGAALRAQSNTERVANDRYARSHDYDLVHERIALTHFDWDSTSFDGSVEVTLIARRAAFDSVILDAGHLLRIKSALDAGGMLAHAEHGDTLVVRLAKPVPFGDTVRFMITYHGAVENGHGLTFIRAGGGDVPHPQQIWSQGEDTDNHLWFPTYDSPNDRLTWEMIVTVPALYSVVSNGRFVSDIPAGKQHTVTWRLESPAPSYLASIVVAPLTRLKDTWKGRPVDYYVYRGGDTAAARRLFAETPDQIAVYSRLTGVGYPWSKYAQVTVADFFGGMENVSATTLVDWIPDRTAYLDRPWYHYELIAHELAHQWFGDYVTTADWANLWLNEGFATFMVGPYWQTRQGAHAGQDYFLEAYDSYLQIDRRRKMPLASLASNNIYPKGALVLEMMRRYLGEERFWAGIHRYLADHAYGNATSDDLRQAMLAATGENLAWFFDEWVYQAGFPAFTVSAAADSAASRLTLTIRQTQTDAEPADSTGLRFSVPTVFRMPATIRVATAKGDVRTRVMLDQREQTVTFDSLPGAPTMVVFDEGNAVLKSLEFAEPTSWLAEQLARDQDLWDRRWAIRQLAARDSDADAGAALARAATGADYYLTRAQASEALGAFPAAIALPALTRALADTSAAVRVAALRGLRTLANDSAFALAARAFDQDRSYAVRAQAIRTLSAAPYRLQRPFVARAIATRSYQGQIANAALISLGTAGDTTFLAAIDSLIGVIPNAAYTVAAMGRRGSAHAYDLLAQRLDDPDPAVRLAVDRAFLYTVPKTIATTMVTAARDRTTDAAIKAQLERLLAAIAKAPEAP